MPATRSQGDVQRRIGPQPRANVTEDDGPTPSRISSKPRPGQPPANVEYKRRNAYLHTIIRRGGAKRTPDGAMGVTLSGRLTADTGRAVGCGTLELDDAPLHADDRRVRPIVGVEFRKNALDSALDGVFGHAELIRNLLVRVPGGDEMQHCDFCWSQGLVGHVLGDLERDLGRKTPRFPPWTARIVCSNSEWSVFLSR